MSNAQFQKTTYGLINTSHGETILTANGTEMVCPDSPVEQQLVQPQIAGGQARIVTVRRPCSNICPKFRSEYLSDGEGAVVHNDCCPGAPGKKIESITNEGEQTIESNLKLNT